MEREHSQLGALGMARLARLPPCDPARNDNISEMR
jgi:hypothetical protein